MRIIIIGDGKVGYSLAQYLSQEDYDVTVIDKRVDVLQKTIDTLDVRCIKGNGVSTRILMEAGVNGADLLIAVTDSDEMNMVCCLTAKKLGAEHTIARIRDPEYASELSLLKEELGLSMVINPEQAAAFEIAKHFKYPYAVNIESYYKGRVDMVGIRVTCKHSIINMKVQEIAKKYAFPVLISAVERNNEVLLPDGNFEIIENDIIHIIGKPADAFNFCNAIGTPFHKMKNILIIGGGRISYYLTKAIDDMGMKVKIIERDMNSCLKLTEMLPNTLIINADGTDEEILKQESISYMDSFVALTGRDEENLIAALLAKQYGVHKVIAKITHLNYTAVNRLGLDTIISPKTITAHNILKYVRGLKNAQGTSVDSIYRIINDQAEAIIFKTNENTKALNIPLSQLRLNRGVIIATILRQNQIIIPRGGEAIRLGDRIIAITKKSNYKDINDITDGGRLNELQNSVKKLRDNINL